MRRNLGEIFDAMSDYWRKPPFSDAQLERWHARLHPYPIQKIDKAANQAMDSLRFMPTPEEFLVFLRGNEDPRYREEETQSYQCTPEEREFNIAMAAQLGRYINKKITIGQLIANARHLEQTHGVGPLDWSMFGEEAAAEPDLFGPKGQETIDNWQHME